MATKTETQTIHWQIWATRDGYTGSWTMYSPNFGIQDTVFSHLDFYFCKAMVVNRVCEIINRWKSDPGSRLDYRDNSRIERLPIGYRSMPAVSR